MCCTSIRGALYFSASIQMFLGLVLLLRWAVMNTYMFLDIFNSYAEAETALVIQQVLSLVYICLFLILGCLIFYGVEKESQSLLKWCGAGLGVLQSLFFIIILLIIFLLKPQDTRLIPQNLFQDPESMTYQILVISTYTVALIASLNYLVLLYMYLRTLSDEEKSRETYCKSTTKESQVSIELANTDRFQRFSHSPSNSEHYQSPVCVSNSKDLSYYGTGGTRSLYSNRQPWYYNTGRHRNSFTPGNCQSSLYGNYRASAPDAMVDRRLMDCRGSQVGERSIGQFGSQQQIRREQDSSCQPLLNYR